MTYSYDTLGRMLAISGASTYAQNMRYRAFGAMKETAYGNGRQFSAQYDRRMRLTNWSVAGVMGWQYDYDKFSERTGRVTYARNLFDQTGQRDASADRSYDYDHVGRLVVSHTGKEARMHTGEPYAATDAYGSYSQAYNYDASGNMTYRVGWGGSYTNYVNQTLYYSNNQLSVNPDTGLQMDYDDAGNLISDGVKTYRYDATGQMTHSLQSGLLMGYDGDRLRVKKTAGTATTYYVRSSVLGGQVVAELNNTGAWTKGYIYLGGQLVATRQSGSVLWVHQDPVTKSQRLTDTSGTPTGTVVDLDPWGGETSKSYNANNYARKFTSYERDADDGDEAQQRRYLGTWRRFSQPDPYDGSASLADPQSLNRYAYTQNDPVNFVDPTGLNKELGDYGSRCGNRGVVVLDEEGNKYCVEEPMTTTYGSLPGIDFFLFGRDAGHVMGVVGGSDNLGISVEGFGIDRYNLITEEVRTLFTVDCAQAFTDAGLKTPGQVTRAGLVIRPDSSLRDKSAAQLNLVSDLTRNSYAGEFSSGRAQGGTIPAVRGGHKLTTDGRTQIYLHNSAFAGASLIFGRASLHEVIVHEFIHAAGQRPISSLLGHDLSNFDHYDKILEACT